jgi:hypothetical protein
MEASQRMVVISRKILLLFTVIFRGDYPSAAFK